MFSFNLEILKFAEPQLSFDKPFNSEGKWVSRKRERVSIHVDSMAFVFNATVKHKAEKNREAHCKLHEETALSHFQHFSSHQFSTIKDK